MRNILVSLIVLLGVYRTNCENTWGCARGGRESNQWLERRRISSQIPQDRNRNFGAHDDPEGCRPCDCDVGGAIDNSCDPVTGQCHCRPNIVGRKCDKPARQYFAHFLDYYKYEGEFAEGSANTRVVIREASAGRERTWTGPGFMRVSEGDSLRFYVDDIPMSMDYDIIVRYEGGMREVWDDVRVTVNRPNQIDYRGPCSGVRPGEDVKSVRIEPGVRHTVVSPSVCLERGVPYQIWLDFNRYRRDRNSPDVSLLIDSIALVPATNSIPIFQGSGVPEHMKQEFVHYRCRDNQITVPKGELSDVCGRYIFSIAAIIQEQALPCECDQYGSYNPVCQPMGGKCQCKPHVIGRRCDQCAPGYYQFGSNGCIPEPKECQDGFYGNPLAAGGCRRCECNEYGWDRRAGNCDKVTGQCPCFPNVIGLRCDRCAPLHWNLQSRTGCQPCNCDPQGSLSQQCDERTGQCQCRPKYGGRTCNNLLECEVNFWGDPQRRCTPCGCNPVGVRTQQCDRRTGQCFCLPAFTGDKCFRCSSIHGELPDCQPCGECYQSWQRVFRVLKNETDWWLREGSKIDPIRPGAYDAELRAMEVRLDEVRRLLAEANMTGGGAEQLNWELNQIRLNLTAASGDLDNVDSELADTGNRIETANNRIISLKRRIEALKREAEQLRLDAMNLKEISLGGALESIRESQRRSREAARKVQSGGIILGESSTKRQQAEDLLRRNGEFERTLRENENSLRNLDIRVDRINSGIVDLNEKVCDGRGDPCDSRCGGGGCGKCGGISCDQGAATKSANSIDLAERADTLLMEKQQIVSQMLRSLRMAQGDTNSAKREAQEAYDKALMLRNMTQGSSDMFSDLLRRMEDFQNQRGARPAEIRAIAEEVLRMSISLTPDQIRNLARQIEELMRNLRNIDAILAATRDDLRRAQRLKLRADDAKADADRILDLAKRVIELLEEAERAQNTAQDAINDALRDITNAQSGLALIETETTAARKTSERSVRRVDNLQDRLDSLKKKYLENEINVQKAEREADSAVSLANRAEANAGTLEAKYSDASLQLNVKYNQTKVARERADSLRIRAARLYQGTYEKIERLRIMESEFVRNERRLIDLSGEIEILNGRMMRYMVEIKVVAKYHRTCTI